LGDDASLNHFVQPSLGSLSIVCFDSCIHQYVVTASVWIYVVFTHLLKPPRSLGHATVLREGMYHCIEWHGVCWKACTHGFAEQFLCASLVAVFHGVGDRLGQSPRSTSSSNRGRRRRPLFATFELFNRHCFPWQREAKSLALLEFLRQVHIASRNQHCDYDHAGLNKESGVYCKERLTTFPMCKKEICHYDHKRGHANHYRDSDSVITTVLRS